MYNVYEIRKQFPMLNGKKTMQGKPLVYLDNSSTTFKPQCVIDAITNYYTNMTANSHRGDYDLAYNMDQQVLNCRKAIAGFVNCEPNEVVFTSGSTMSSNLIAYGYGDKFIKEGDEILLEETGHASNLLPWFKLAERTGAIIKYIDLDKEGRITAKNLQNALNSKTKIVALACVTNVLGYEIDIKEFASIIHKVGAIFVVDGAQSVPHIKTDFKDSDIDFLFFSAHKMCGPTGIGCLIGKYNLLDKMDSFITGGGMNETFEPNGEYVLHKAPEKLEGGTHNIEGIYGLNVAIKYLESIGMENIEKYESELRSYAMNKLREVKDIVIYNENANSGIISFNVKGVFAQDLATLLNSKGIAVRSGNHCAKILKHQINEIATVRASFYFYNTKEEIDALVEALKEGGNFLDAYFA